MVRIAVGRAGAALTVFIACRAEDEDDEDDDAQRHGGYYWLAERAKGEDASDEGDEEDDDDANSEYYPHHTSTDADRPEASASHPRDSPSAGAATAAVAAVAAATAHETRLRTARNSSSGGGAAPSGGSDDSSSTSFALGLHHRANPLPLDEHGNVVPGMMVTKLVIQGPVDPDFGSGTGSPSVAIAASACSTPVGGGTDAAARSRRMSFGQHMGSLVRKVGDLADTLVERLTGEGGAGEEGNIRSPSLLSLRTSFEGSAAAADTSAISPAPISPTVSNITHLGSALQGTGLGNDGEHEGTDPGGGASAFPAPPPLHTMSLTRRASTVNPNLGSLPSLQENSVMSDEDIGRASARLRDAHALPGDATGRGSGRPCPRHIPPSASNQASAPTQLGNGSWTQHPAAQGPMGGRSLGSGGGAGGGSAGGGGGWAHERPPLSGVAPAPRGSVMGGGGWAEGNAGGHLPRPASSEGGGAGMNGSSSGGGGGGGGQAGDGGSSSGFPQRLGQHVKRRLEVLAGGLGGGPGDMSKLCLQGRMLMPAGMHDAVIPIFDNEPTSIISYFLYTRAYQQALNDRMKAALAEVKRSGNNPSSDLAALLGPAVLPSSFVASKVRQPSSTQRLSAPPTSALPSVPTHTCSHPDGKGQQQRPSRFHPRTPRCLPHLRPPLLLNQRCTLILILILTTAPAGGVILSPPLPPAAAAHTAAAPTPAATADGRGKPPPPPTALPPPPPFLPLTAITTPTPNPHLPRPLSPATTEPTPPPSPPNHTQQQQQQQQQPMPSRAASGQLGAAAAAAAAAAAQGSGPQEADWLNLLLSKEKDGSHIRHTFEDEAPGLPLNRAKFTVVAYYAPQFAELRRRCVQGGDAAFISSLCRCRTWDTRAGKSNAYFAKTRDDRYIVKSLSKVEKQSFLDFATSYFEHVAKACLTGRPMCLAKVVGVFSLSMRSTAGGLAPLRAGLKEGVIDLVIMENCFYDRQIHRIYDLKGSERNRYNADAANNPNDSKEVHLDDNLRRTIVSNPMCVTPASRCALEAAVWADTAFLASLNVMDYSLLVGLDRDNNVLAVAIIDFIRTYTLDKQLETWVKIMAGDGKKPTIISPRQYMKRFRTSLLGYFTVVPSSGDVPVPLDPDA
ncbi:MAG: hypothetical protein WDW38_003314 [Sanguina aurantia]